MLDDFNQSLIDAKERMAQSRAHQSGRSGSDRLPPGQYLTQGFPILDLGIRPEISKEQWELRIFGDIDHEILLNWNDLQKLPQKTFTKDFSCVTSWTKYDITWTGVKFADIAALAKPKPEAVHLMLHSSDNYTTNISLAEAIADGYIVHSLEGKDIPKEHGGPVRFLMPPLYGWKSAKFLSGIEFLPKQKLGFWEVRGYHSHADPWTEERYS